MTGSISAHLTVHDLHLVLRPPWPARASTPATPATNQAAGSGEDGGRSRRAEGKQPGIPTTLLKYLPGLKLSLVEVTLSTEVVGEVGGVMQNFQHDRAYRKGAIFYIYCFLYLCILINNNIIKYGTNNIV